MGTINDLQLISSVTDSINIPGDNGTQTYRLTTSQLKLYVEAYLENRFVPAGTVISNMSEDTPGGYLYCDGSAVSRTTYADLYAAIGDASGEGDGSTTFNLPDLRGYFLRGQDDSEGNDPNAGSRTAQTTGGNTGDNVGSEQPDAMQSHLHTFTKEGGTGSYGGGAIGSDGGTASTTAPIVDGANGTPRTSSETRPKNVNVRYYIKF